MSELLFVNNSLALLLHITITSVIVFGVHRKLSKSRGLQFARSSIVMLTDFFADHRPIAAPDRTLRHT